MTEDSTEHTPGPWRVAENRHKYDTIIRSPQNDPIAATIMAGFPIKEARANARLIAAAPDRAEIADELLAALKALVDVVKSLDMVHGRYEPQPNSVMHQALAAIAIAEYMEAEK